MSRAADTEALASPVVARTWAKALPACVLAAVALCVPFWETGRRLVELWMDNASYGHGVLIVPVSLYLLWLRRDALRHAAPRPWWPGLAAVAALMAAWLVSRVLGVLMGEQLVLVAMLVAVPLALLGRRVAAIVAAPVAYLMCAVPIWTYLVPVLQVHTATASTELARALGVPIYLEGLYMSIPDGRFLVADVCSGLRYLLASLSLAGFYALLNLHLWWTRAVLLAASFVLGIAFNYVRVTGIVLIGHHTQMQSSLVHDHNTYGWLLFLLVVTGVLVLGRILEHWDRPPQAGEPPRAPTSPVAAAPLNAMATLVALLALAPAGLAAYWLQPPASVPALPLDGLARGEWQAFPRSPDAWQPAYGHPDATAHSTFRRGREQVDVFVAFYPTQRQDAEAINEAHRVADQDAWKEYSITVAAPRVELQPGVVGEEFLIRATASDRRRVVWRTAWINGRFVVDPAEAKVQQLLGFLTGRRAAAAIVVSALAPGREDQARATLREFLDEAFPHLLGELREAAGADSR